jgi:hydrogenase maturation protease
MSGVLVAGIGNVFLGDDAFGCHVIQRLLEEGVPDAARVEDFGIRGFDLANALASGVDAAILVDAAPRGDAPGTISVIEPTDDADPADPGRLLPPPAVVDGHGLDPLRVLRLADALGGRPRRLVVVAVEPARIWLDVEDADAGLTGLSEPVAGAVGPAAALVRRLIGELTSDRPPRSTTARDGMSTSATTKEGDPHALAKRRPKGRRTARGSRPGDRARVDRRGRPGRPARRPVAAGGAALPPDEADVTAREATRA